MPRAVVLEHTLPDGSAHFDWMIEHPALTGERRLATWRTAARPDRADAFSGERIGDHRAAYLAFEGEIPGGRGRVRRVAQGEARWESLGRDRLRVAIRWDGAGERVYEGHAGDEETWRFDARPD
jgi:hypothetical protein